MELLSKYKESLKKPCPYCRAKSGNRCKIVEGSIYTIGSEPRDQWGRPLVHNARVKRRGREE